MACEAGDPNPRFFVTVHVGAGYHSPSNEKALRSAMKRACLAAASILSKVCISVIITRKSITYFPYSMKTKNRRKIKEL